MRLQLSIIVLSCILVLAYTVIAFDPEPAPFWWLNTFLAQKYIGHFEPNPGFGYAGVGPCPDYGRKCKVDFTKLPQAIKNIGVVLPAPFDSTVTLGNAIPTGYVNIWMLEISDVEMKNIAVSGQSISPSKERFDLQVQDFKFNARTNLQLVDLTIPGGIGLWSIDVNVSIAKAMQTAGTQVDLKLNFEAPPGKTLATSIPNNVTVDQCSLTTNLGLQLGVNTKYPFDDKINQVTGFLAGIADPLLGYLLCSVIKQLFITVEGKPGLIQGFVDDAFTAIGNLSSLPDPNVDAEELKIVNQLTPPVKNHSISFRDNLVVKGASNVLNDFLGVPDGNPFVNEAVNLLSSPDNGTAHFDALQELGFSMKLNTSVFHIDVDFLNLTLKGLNTFQKFELIKNNYQLAPNLRDEYTLENRVKMGSASLKLLLDLTLTDNVTGPTNGGWIYRQLPFTGQSSTSLRVELEAGLTGLDLVLFLTIVNDPSALQEVQLGQLLGKSGDPNSNFAQQLSLAGQCAAPAMHAFAIPFFTLSVLDLLTPNLKLTPVDSGISNLLNNSTSRILNIVESAIKNNLLDISQHWLRPTINSIAADAFVSDSAHGNCPPYLTQDKTSPNFESSRIFFSLAKAIRDVVGGDPVKQTAVSINQLIPIAMNFVIQAFGFSATNPASGDWVFTPDLRLLPGKSFVGDSPFLNSSFQLNGVNLFGLDSVTKLLLESTGPQSLVLKLELGTVGNPFEILFKNQLSADYIGELDIDEGFDLRITLSGLKINVALGMDMDLNELYLLTVSDLSKSACLLAPFVFLNLDLDVSVSNFALQLTHDPKIPTGQPGNKLRVALAQLAAEPPSPNLKNMLNYVFSSVRSFVSTSLDGVSNSVINSSNCADQFNAFDTLTARVTKAFLNINNFTDLLSKATRYQPPPLDPLVADAQVFIGLGGVPFDLRESTIATAASKAVKFIPQTSYYRFLTILGNGSGDVFQDSFVTELDGSVSFDVNFTQYFPNGFSLDALATNATVYPRRLRLTNLDKLVMSSLKLLEPVSKFVTKTYIEIDGTVQFQFDVDLDLPLALKNPSATGNAVESVSIAVELDHLVIDVELLTALNQAKLHGLSLASFVTLDANGRVAINPSLIECLSSVFFQNGLSINRLQIGTTGIRPTLSISPNVFVSAGTEAVIQALTQVFFDFVAKDLADFTQGGIRPFLNTFILEHYTSTRHVCTHPPIPQLPPSQQFLDFNASEIVHSINHFLRDVLRGNTPPPYALINSIITGVLDEMVFLKETSTYPGSGVTDWALKYKGAVLSIMSIYLSDISLKNAGTIRNLNVLEPISNTTFYNDIDIAGPLKFSFVSKLWVKELFEGYGPEGSKDELKFDFTFTNISLNTFVTMEVNIPDLMLVSTGSLTNLSQLACVLSPLRKLKFQEFNMDLGSFVMDVTCAGTCNSPYFASLQNGGKFTTNFDIEFLGGLLSLGIKTLVDYMNSPGAETDINNKVGNASVECAVALDLTPVVKVFNPPAIHGLNVAVIFGLGWLGVVAALLLLLPTLWIRHNQLKDKYLAANLVRANAEPGATSQSVARYMAKAERSGLALAWHPEISVCCKIVVPLVCMINVALLILSFLVYLNFEMSGSLYLLGQKTKVVTLVPWYISSTINDMWNSGAWPLSVLVVFMSCAWPVIKNVLLFMIWFAPKHFLNHERREWTLVIMDILGKWSFLDIYVIVVFVGALRFSLVLADAPAFQLFTIPEKAFILDATVIPGTGIIMLCSAALASLVINHVIIWQMHKAEFADARLFKIIDGQPDQMLTPKAQIHLRISDYCFSSCSPDGKRDRFSPRAKNQVILMMGFVLLVMIVGFFVPYFTLTYDGLVGLAIGFFIDGGRKRTLSLISIGLKVMDATDGSPRLNVIFLFFQVTYYLTVCVAPVVHILLHGYLWLKPMTLKQAKTVFFFAKVAAYWAALEVFALAIIMTTLEVKPITYFLVDVITGNTCQALRPELAKKLEKNADCLLPGAYLEWGFPIIFIANIMQIGVGIIMLRASGVAIRDREETLEGHPHRMWSWSEYLIVQHLMAHNCDHLKPNYPMFDFKKRSSLTKSLLDHSKTASDHSHDEITHQQGKKISSSTGGMMGCCGCIGAYLDSCFGGVKDVSITAPIASPANTRWNLPPPQPLNPSHASTQRTTFTQAVRTSLKSRFNSPPVQVMDAALTPASHVSASDNPVFRQERTRVSSLEV